MIERKLTRSDVAGVSTWPPAELELVARSLASRRVGASRAESATLRVAFPSGALQRPTCISFWKRSSRLFRDSIHAGRPATLSMLTSTECLLMQARRGRAGIAIFGTVRRRGYAASARSPERIMAKIKAWPSRSSQDVRNEESVIRVSRGRFSPSCRLDPRTSRGA